MGIKAGFLQCAVPPFLNSAGLPGLVTGECKSVHRLLELPAVRNKGTWARSLLNGIISSP